MFRSRWRSESPRKLHSIQAQPFILNTLLQNIRTHLTRCLSLLSITHRICGKLDPCWNGRVASNLRGQSSMPPERARPRQEPVSCESCRKKKLKCNREHPCSNCLARGTICDFQGRKLPAFVDSTTPPPLNDSIANLRAENTAIKSRLERLVDTVLRGSYEAEGRPAKARRLAEPERTTQLPSPPATFSSIEDVEIARSYKDDFQRLESVGKLVTID